MKKLECDGCCETFDGCEGEVRAVVVSRVGERNLCMAACASFEAVGYVVSCIATQYGNIYAKENEHVA